MNHQGRSPRPWRYFTLALAVPVVLGVGAIGTALGYGGVSSLFAGHRQVAPTAAGALPGRYTHVATKPSPSSFSRSTLHHPTAAGQGKGPPIAKPRGRKRFGEKPFVAKPLVAEIESSRALLEIPAIGVHAPLVPTGAEGAPGAASLTVPGNIHTVAWWDGTVLDGDRVVHEKAPRPGQPGVAIIAGHIDSALAGPGALYDLRDLGKGDMIKIVDSLGRISTWTVSGPPETALKINLPSALWVSNGPPKLAIVTCGGPFDAATGHYLDNVIVWATPSRLHPGEH